MLIPVNLGGVFKSIQQLIAKQKIPFSRTPKVMGRTAVPPLYILSQYLFLLYCTSRSIADYQSGCWMHAVFVFVTAIFFVYILVNFIGLKESIIDLFCLQKQKLSTFEQCERPVVENLDVRN
jgi:hypothetical protein